MNNKKISHVGRVIAVLEKIEDGILIGLLLVVIFMAVLQIFLRNFFDSGILWGDPLIRILVLWIGLIGAMVASRRNNHIRIDVISRYLPESIKKMTMLILSIFTALVCGAMTYFGLGLVIMEQQDGLLAFANIPAWVCESIIPFSFAIISLRYILFSFNGFVKLFKHTLQ